MRLVILLALGSALFAGDTKHIDVSKKEHFLEGEELNGVILSGNKLKLGFASQTMKLADEASAYSGCIASDGTLYVGTGSGKINKVKDGKSDLAFDTGEHLVTDMIISGDELYAATIPNGKIFRMDKDGAWKEFAKVGSTHPWCLALGPEGILVGCGKPAKLYSVDKDGKVTEVYAPKADHIFAVVGHKSGCYIGTANPGYLISYLNKKPFVMFDFGNNDVKAIKTANDCLYVAVNQRQSQTPPELLKAIKPKTDTPKKNDKEPDSPFKDKKPDKNPSNQDKKDDKKEEDPISGKWTGTAEAMGQKSDVTANLKLDGKNVTGTMKSSQTPKETEIKGTYENKKLVFEFTDEIKAGNEVIKMSVKIELKLTKEDTLEGTIEVDVKGMKVSGTIKLTRVEKTTTKTTDPKVDPKTDPTVNPTTDPIPTPQSAPSFQSQSAVWKFTDSNAENLCDVNFYITGLASTTDGLFISSNQAGRVFKVVDRTAELYYDFDSISSVGLVTKGGSLAAVLLAEPGAVGFPSTTKTKTGTYVSKVFDTKFLSKIGNINVRKDGNIEVYVRGGNTLKPEEGWSDWAGPVTKFPSIPNLQKVRFVQFKVVLSDDKCSVDGVTLYYQTDNQRPKIMSIQIPPTPTILQTSSPIPNPSVTGTKINRMTMKNINWQAQDPDGDVLVYRLYYRSANSSTWTPLNSNPTNQPNFNWNTESVADGKYVLKVVASDETNNSADALTAEMETDVITVDNTKPDIKITSTSGGTAKGTATDAMSNILRLDYQLNGGVWASIKPKSGIFDSNTSEFELALDKLAKGSNIVTIMAIDSELNVTVNSFSVESK